MFQFRNNGRFNMVAILRSWPIILLIIIGFTQVERFVQQGTILGYQVRSVTTKKAQQLQNQSGSLLNPEASSENKKSIACDTFSEKEVAKVLGGEVVRISGFMPDRTEPNLVSSCIYRAKDESGKTASILLREMKDADAASKTIKSISGNKQTETVESIGDEAIFNISANQLTVQKGKRLITVTVTAATDKKIDKKSIALSIAKIGL